MVEEGRGGEKIGDEMRRGGNDRGREVKRIRRGEKGVGRVEERIEQRREEMRGREG